jgi:site-specific DNA-methyltransferase (adenine-specific)
MKAVKEFGRRTNIWPYAVGGKDVGHPAPFPEALARDHILTWSNPGAVVLDPFAGSGTTLAMALQSGRNYIGIEFAAEYLPIIRQRLATTGPLFTTVE